MNYYNEFDKDMAAWLRELIRVGAIPNGDVDDRSIEDVTPNDLAGYTQCHFFAGIGGWPLALAMAGIAPTTPLWTGSCPCQPYSQAGEGKGFADERHLWPAWQWLIAKHKPAIVIGEQVASKFAEPWFDLVQADMEAMGYAFGCVPFPAASVGAPHIRDRAYWVAYANSARSQGWHVLPERFDQQFAWSRGVADSIERQPYRLALHNGWGIADWLACMDGKQRPVEPCAFPLADGVPACMGRLRGYGNAIVPQQAAEFIVAALGAIA